MIWRTSKPEKDIILFDLEGDSLDPDKIHCVSYCTIYSNGKWCNFKTVPINTITSLPEMKKFFERDVYFCGHNIALWDIPCAVNKLLTKNIKNDLIDTLWISRYIFPSITKHGLADWGDLFGVPKPVVEDWENSPLHVYVERCEEDVRINSVLMGHIMKKLDYLYEEESNKWKCIWYLNFLADTVALQEKVKWKLDVKRCQEMFDKLSFEKQEKIDSLKLVMPKNPIKFKRKKPKVTEKKDGTPNAHYVKWIKLLKDQKLPLDTEGEVEYIKDYEEGNPSSPVQIKSWLYSLGWIPKNFSYVRDKDTGKNRDIPQILVDKKGEKVLCPSVRKLLLIEPNLELLEGISVLTHRIGMFKGFLSNVDKDGYLKASAAGLTNTTRLRHKVLVNLPGNGKPYGEDVRGCLIAPDGYELCGSDLSSLENRTMQHFIYDIDPDYVNSMMEEDFDPHCDLGLIAGIMTQEDVDFYKSVEDPNKLSHDDHDKYGIIKSERHKSKTTVYCVPTDTTEILTDSGWKFYHQITMSDKVLSLNTETGKTEFTDIIEIPYFEDVEIVNVKHRDFNFECTLNHRWWTQRRSGKLRKSKTYEFKETKDFSTETNIICSAKFSGDSQRKDLSLLDLKLLGVILGDGSVSFSKVTNNTSQSNGKVQVKATVTQKRYVKEISDLIGMVLPSTTFTLSDRGITKFQFSSPEFRNWWTNKLGFGHTNKHDVDYEKFILTLDQDQIESFIEGIFITDGGYKKGVNSKQYYQCTGNIEKSIITGLTLIGKRIRYYDEKLHSGKVIRTITASDTTHTSYQKGKTTNSRTCNVFCVNNINGTFIMRQGDSISITGNSATYGIGANKLSIELDISLQEASALLKAYWKRNWSIKVLCKKQKIKRLRIGGETEMWLFNPMSKLWYSLRYEKDIFSTLNQGAGTFVFNSWVKCLRKKRNLITGQFHDEIILTVKKGYRKECKELVINSLQEVNDELKLNREMACDVQFGDNYSQIH